jgi:hypothetical protein
MHLHTLFILAALALTAFSTPAESEKEVFDLITEPTIEQMVAFRKGMRQIKGGQLSPEDEQQLQCDSANMRATLMHFYIKPDVNKAGLGWTQQDQVAWYKKKFASTPNTQGTFDVDDSVLASQEYVYRMLSYNTMTYCDKDVVEGVSGYVLPGPEKLTLLPGKFTLPVWNLVSDFLYYIAVNPTQKALVVSFRGSVSKNDWVADAQSWFTPVDAKLFPGAPAGAQVRFGVQDLTSKLVNDPRGGLLVELDKLTKTYPTYQIVMTGHSLGGNLCMSSFLAVKLKRPNWNLRATYPIGGAIIGNALFTDWLSETVGPNRVLRIVSTDDVVPYMSDNAWKKNVKPDELIRQSKASPMVYFTSPYTPQAPTVCVGPHDPKCDQFTCVQRHWEHHSWYGGFWMGERYCLMSAKPQVRGINA